MTIFELGKECGILRDGGAVYPVEKGEGVWGRLSIDERNA